MQLRWPPLLIGRGLACRWDEAARGVALQDHLHECKRSRLGVGRDQAYRLSRSADGLDLGATALLQVHFGDLGCRSVLSIAFISESPFYPPSFRGPCGADGAHGTAMEKALMAMGSSSWTLEIALRIRRSARACGKILRPAFRMERGWARASNFCQKEADSSIWPDGQ